MRHLCLVGLLAMAAAGFLALVSSDAGASDIKVFRFTYPVVTSAQDAGHEVAGPGGARQLRGDVSLLGWTGDPLPEADDLLIVVQEDPAACGPPNPFTSAPNFTIQWPNDCVFPTDFVIARFTTSKGPIVIERAYWTNASGDSIAPAEVQQLLAPATPQWALALLVMGLGLVGVTTLRMRRRGVRA